MFTPVFVGDKPALELRKPMSPTLLPGGGKGFGYARSVVAAFVYQSACVKRPDLLSGLALFNLTRPACGRVSLCFGTVAWMLAGIHDMN